jgi:hypothetical protein
MKFEEYLHAHFFLYLSSCVCADFLEVFAALTDQNSFLTEA